MLSQLKKIKRELEPLEDQMGIGTFHISELMRMAAALHCAHCQEEGRKLEKIQVRKCKDFFKKRGKDKR